jgi:aerobic-type carbon monoxide dehydrogenase small subunit (CoxS/CutS family)
MPSIFPGSSSRVRTSGLLLRVVRIVLCRYCNTSSLYNAAPIFRSPLSRTLALALLSPLLFAGYRTYPILFVNGKRVSVEQAKKARPNQTLLNYLRTVLLLTGSKLGCAEGGCGACTVLISKKANEGGGGAIRHYTVNACLMPVLAADGCHITTVEGVGTVVGGSGSNLHPVQKAMVDMHGSQCGTHLKPLQNATISLFSNLLAVSLSRTLLCQDSAPPGSL